MRRLLCLCVWLALPASSYATTPLGRLIEERSLAFHASAVPILPVLRAQYEVPPPPPLPAPEEEIPSLGKILGFMINGGALMGAGAYIALNGLLWVLELGIVGGASFALIGWVVVGIGAIMAGVGLPLFLVGNDARMKRKQFRATGGLGFGFDPASRSAHASYAFEF